MSYLLDTHAYLWWALGDPRLSRPARAAIEAREKGLYLSAASVWELALKHAIGKLVLKGPLARIAIEEPARNGIRSLDITREHACRTGELPLHHRDPFDRLLVAQAQLEGLTLITADPAFSDYDVATLW
jgi:PIN domain nuclease of toxin-antitoxin system